MPGQSGSGRANGSRGGKVIGTISPASAMPRMTPAVTAAARARSAPPRGPSASAASTRSRASVSRDSGGGVSAACQPTGAESGRSAFTRSAIASTSPGAASV